MYALRMQLRYKKNDEIRDRKTRTKRKKKNKTRQWKVTIQRKKKQVRDNNPHHLPLHPTTAIPRMRRRIC